MHNPPTPHLLRASLVLLAIAACGAAVQVRAQQPGQQPVQQPARQQTQPPAQQKAQQPDKPQPEPEQQKPARRPRTERVWLKELEGTWIARPYLEALRVTHSPQAAVRKQQPIAITIRKEGRSYPMVITNFRQAKVGVALEIEPDTKPESWRIVFGPDDRPVSTDEVTYVYFKGDRNSEGRFDIITFLDPVFAQKKPLPFLRLARPLDQFVNNVVIAGDYKDAEGNAYRFSEAGEAVFPDRTFAYEVALNPPGCDYLQTPGGKEAAVEPAD